MNATSGNRLSREPPQQRTELPALTSLRGLAALTVLLFHSSSLALTCAGGANTGFALWKIYMNVEDCARLSRAISRAITRR